jgi:hypothetical protein
MHTDIIITNILTTKTAFGVLAEGTESVFIPGKVADAANIRIGQTVRAVLVPNQTMPERTPWMAVYIGAAEDADTLADEIRADLERGPATAQQVAKSINQPVDLVARKMREMSGKGGLVHDTVYALSMLDLIDEETE